METFDQIIQRELRSSMDLHRTILEDNEIRGTLGVAARSAANSIEAGGKIIFAGNGGSFADAQHLAAEFIGNMGVPRPSLPSVALGTNLSSVTAIGNDFDFNDIFVREFSAIASQKDFLILISTSGNSKNLLPVANFAQGIGVKGLILSGKSGGQLLGLFPTVLVPHQRTERIQEIHILLGHIFCELVEKSLGYRT